MADAARPDFASAQGEAWTVAHTKPRCEKKLANLLTAERMAHFLPLLESVRQYEGRIRPSFKPLFPGYVFLRLPHERRARVFQQDLIARLLPVDDEPRLLQQLAEVHAVVHSGLTVALAPLMKRGARVRVTAGPLQGLEGQVDDPSRPAGIVLAVDVLRQGIHVRIPFEHLRILP